MSLPQPRLPRLPPCRCGNFRWVWEVSRWLPGNPFGPESFQRVVGVDSRRDQPFNHVERNNRLCPLCTETGPKPGAGRRGAFPGRGPCPEQHASGGLPRPRGGFIASPSIVVGAQTLKEVTERLCRPPPFGTVCEADGHVGEPRVKSQTTAVYDNNMWINHASDALTRTACCYDAHVRAVCTSARRSIFF